MEDSFQFIIESPQHSQGQKKRPRLVTSCDNWQVLLLILTPNDSLHTSRLKKIKCLQPSPEAKCEACRSAKIPCRFRDRERYFAERSRAIAGPNSGVYATELRSIILPSFPVGFSFFQSGPNLILFLMGFQSHLVRPALPFPLSPILGPTPIRLKQAGWSLQRSRTPLAILPTPLTPVIPWALPIGVSFHASSYFLSYSFSKVTLHLFRRLNL
jgi:hypothetical protein